MKRLGVLISGSGSNLQSLIDKIESGEISASISIVISSRENAYGLKRAENHGIPTAVISKKKYDSEHEFNKALLGELEKHKVDLVVLAGYLNILSPQVVDRYKNRIINIHPSLIPAFCGKGYYGERVHKAVLDYGVKVTGATVHFVDHGTDTGPIILQKPVMVEQDDDVSTLAERVLKVEHELLPEAVKLLVEDKLIVKGRKVMIKSI